MVLLGIGEWGLPVSPSQALRSLTSKTQYVLTQAEEALVDEADQVTIGDIVIEYTFPEYTGMTPVRIPNSNGEIHAPQGTAWRCQQRRSKDLRLCDRRSHNRRLPATLNFGRRIIQAEFDLLAEGEYLVLFLMVNRRFHRKHSRLYLTMMIPL